MHDAVKRAVAEFIAGIGGAEGKAVADLGARDLNGSVKDVVPGAVGFDLAAGPGVDVVIELGCIPEEHRGRYDIVTSVSSFQFCPHPECYKSEITALLKPGGRLFLSMCAPSCGTRHTTVPPWDDCFRMSLTELKDLLAPEIRMVTGEVRGHGGHEDILFTGVRT